ncbi:hypothetical protein F7725_010130, partial [Dissostichus mawsoni]
MRLLDPDQLSSSIAILQELKRLYGRVTPVAQLRAQFFKCYQQEEETAASFLLRLRELFHQWEEVEPAGSAQDERTIRDQLVLGLRPGMVQQELQRQVRRNPTMSFREVSGEVKALETELRMESACASRVSVPQPRPAMAPSSLEEWRETVRTELRKEMKDQLSIITETLTEEIRRQLSPQNAPRLYPTPNRLAQGRHNVYLPGNKGLSGTNVANLFAEAVGRLAIFRETAACKGAVKLTASATESHVVGEGNQGNQADRPSIVVACPGVEILVSQTDSSDGPVGVARLTRQESMVVPPNSEMVLWNQLYGAETKSDFCALVEGPERDDEWQVARTVAWVVKGRLPIRVCNPNPYPVTIPQRRPLANVFQVEPSQIRGEKDLVLKTSDPGVVEVDVQ